MAKAIITKRDIADGAIVAQPRVFDRIAGKDKAARVFFYFQSAGVLHSMPHSLRRAPTNFTVVMANAAAGAPTIYSETPPQFTSNYVALKSTVANSWAEVLFS